MLQRGSTRSRSKRPKKRATKTKRGKRHARKLPRREKEERALIMREQDEAMRLEELMWSRRAGAGVRKPKRRRDPHSSFISVEHCTGSYDPDEKKLLRAIEKSERGRHAGFIVDDVAEEGGGGGDDDGEESEWVFSSSDGKGGDEAKEGTSASAAARARPRRSPVRTRGMLHSPDRVPNVATVYRAVNSVRSACRDYRRDIQGSYLVAAVGSEQHAKYVHRTTWFLKQLILEASALRATAATPPPLATLQGWVGIGADALEERWIAYMGDRDDSVSAPASGMCEVSGLRFTADTAFRRGEVVNDGYMGSDNVPLRTVAEPTIELLEAVSAFRALLETPMVQKGKTEEALEAESLAYIQMWKKKLSRVETAVYEMLYTAPVKGSDTRTPKLVRKSRQRKKKKRRRTVPEAAPTAVAAPEPTPEAVEGSGADEDEDA